MANPLPKNMEANQQNKRNLRNRTRKFYYENEEEMDLRSSYQLQDKLHDSKFEIVQHVVEMHGSEFNIKYLQQNGWNYPILLKSIEGTGLKVPPNSFTVTDVQNFVGSKRMIDVIDVNTQKGTEMTMTQWVKYYTSFPRRRILNVISLEFSHSKLDELVESPTVVREIDWVDNVWPKEQKSRQTSTTNVMEEMKYPKVKKYVLMSVAGCFTDFHIDFGGSSVWYHVLRGSKVFWLIPPTEENLKLYEQWVLSGKQQDIFLGDVVVECSRVHLQQGDTFMIPTGWIHAVYTPTDALVFGGNFLHSYNIEKQLRINIIEDRTKIPSKFRYPFYYQIHWHTAKRYLEILENRKEDEEESSLQEDIIPSTISTEQEIDYDYITTNASTIPYNSATTGNTTPLIREYHNEESNMIGQPTYQQHQNHHPPHQSQVHSMQLQHQPPSSIPQALEQQQQQYPRSNEIGILNQINDSTISNWNQPYGYPMDYRTDTYFSDKDQLCTNNNSMMTRSSFSQEIYYNQPFLDQSCQSVANQNFNYQYGYQVQLPAQPQHATLSNDSLLVQPAIVHMANNEQVDSQSLKRKADTGWDDWGKDSGMLDNYVITPTNTLFHDPYSNQIENLVLDDHVSNNSISENKCTKSNNCNGILLPIVVHRGLVCLANKLESSKRFQQNIPENIKNPFELIRRLKIALHQHRNDDPNLALTGISLLHTELRNIYQNSTEFHNNWITNENDEEIAAESKSIVKHKNVNEPRGGNKPSLRRRTRCRKCEACVRDDCGSCRTCKDMKKFGGPGRMKQSCLLRVCISPVLPINTKCDICNGGPSTSLMECAICAQIVHPPCLISNENGTISTTIPNRWRCPNCLESEQIGLDSKVADFGLNDTSFICQEFTQLEAT